MPEDATLSPTIEVARARQAPHEHVPRLVTSRDVAGEGVLDRIADVVNRLGGSMWLFVGISVGMWGGPRDVEAAWHEDRVFVPHISDAYREHLYGGWLEAVDRTLTDVEVQDSVDRILAALAREHGAIQR